MTMKTVKFYRIMSRSFKARRGPAKGKRMATLPLRVNFNPTVGQWTELRPIIAWCWTFVIREAIDDLGPEAPVVKHGRREYTLNIKHSYRWRGTAWQWKQRADLRVADRTFDEAKHPRTWRYCKYHKHDGFPTYETRSWIESLIVMVAHELWHLVGDIYSKGVESELTTELVTDAALTVWRKEQKRHVPQN